MENCQFCKIIRDEIPADKVWEDEKHLAFLDIRPFSAGHTLLVPKQHVERISEMEPEGYVELFAAIPPLARAIVAGVGAEGFNVYIANGSAAGQEIPHAHIHLVPRLRGDGIRFESEPSDAPVEAFEATAKKIRAVLADIEIKLRE